MIESHHVVFCLSVIIINKMARRHTIAGYKRNIHSIADLMILAKSNTFVGEFYSNWGRIVRIFRAHFNDKYAMHDSNSFSLGDLFRDEETAEPPVLFHDTRTAFGEGKLLPPPGW